MFGKPQTTPDLSEDQTTTPLVRAPLPFSPRVAFRLDSDLACTKTLLRAISGWIPRHLTGAVLVSLPAMSVFSHVTCDMHLSIQVRPECVCVCVCVCGGGVMEWKDVAYKD